MVIINRNKYYNKCACDEAEYIDEVFICHITGKECELGLIPIKNCCIVAQRDKYKNKKNR